MIVPIVRFQAIKIGHVLLKIWSKVSFKKQTAGHTTVLHHYSITWVAKGVTSDVKDYAQDPHAWTNLDYLPTLLYKH